MNDLLFDVPWWIPTLLALLGIVVFWNGNNRQNRRLRNTGTGLLLLAVAWFTVSYLVDTDKEKCQKGTKQLVADVVNGRWNDFQSRLAPDVNFRVQGGRSYAKGADSVAHYAHAGADAIHLDSANVQSTYAEQTGTLITVTAYIYSNQSGGNNPPTMNSTFDFDWVLLNQGWVVREIRIKQVGNMKAQDMEAFMQFVK